MKNEDIDKLIAGLYEGEADVPIGLEHKLSTLIDSWEDSEEVDSKSKNRVIFRKRILSIAATVLLIVSIGFWYQYQNTGNVSTFTNTYEDPQESQEVVVEALRLFSQNFSKGTKTIEKADNRINNTFEVLGQVINETSKQVKNN